MTDGLLLNVGNTHTQIAALCAGVLGPVRCVRTAALLTGEPLPELSGGREGGPCLAACVVPAAADALRRHCGAARLRFLDASMVTEIDFSLVEAATVGADRIANAVALAETLGVPGLVVDCGTAITLEAVDGARRFRGGAILPGRQLQRRSLHEHTALLPLVGLEFSRPSAFGTCTEGAICAGIDIGTLGALRELIDTVRASLGGAACAAVLIGGDAAYFARHLPGVVRGSETFTLAGLAAVAAHLHL